jgi:hypothetical protein
MSTPAVADTTTTAFGAAVGWARARLADDLWATVLAATMLGSLVRIAFVLAVDFPVNDGGMFYAMVRDLQDANYRLPETTSYNQVGIPYAYPPLMFYVTAAINDLTGVSLLTLFRVLPVVASILTIPAFFLVSRSLLKDRFAVEISVIAFALIPRAFDWQISGGGLTRAYGLLFALLAIHQSIRFLLRGRSAAWLPMALFAALALLCHPEMGLFFAYSFAVLFAFSSPSKKTLVQSVAALSLAGAMSSPWWATVMLQHGPNVLLDAGTSGAAAAPLALRIIDPSVFDEPMFPSMLALSFIGALYCIGRRDYVLPVWLVALFIVEPRKAPTDAAAPAALLIGLAVAFVLFPLFKGRTQGARRSLVYSLTALWAILAALTTLSASSPLASVSADGQNATAWVRADAPVSATFAVVTERTWALDSLSEWFPVLTGRKSVATAQGYEWLGGDRFVSQQDIHHELQLCGDLDAQCLDDWSQQFGLQFTHVFIARENTFALVKGPDDGCCEGLRRSLSADPRYRLTFEGPGGAIFERLP